MPTPPSPFSSRDRCNVIMGPDPRRLCAFGLLRDFLTTLSTHIHLLISNARPHGSGEPIGASVAENRADTATWAIPFDRNSVEEFDAELDKVVDVAPPIEAPSGAWLDVSTCPNPQDPDASDRAPILDESFAEVIRGRA